MNKWLKVVALVMLTLVSAVALRSALSNQGSSVMVAKDGGLPPPPDPW